jgi:hypothetical protein
MFALYEGCGCQLVQFDIGGQLAHDVKHWPTSACQFADYRDSLGLVVLSPAR